MKDVKGAFVARKIKGKFITLRSWNQTEREDAVAIIDLNSVIAAEFCGDKRTKVHLIGGGCLDLYGHVSEVSKELELE